MTKFQMTLAALATTLLAAPMIIAGAEASTTSDLQNCRYDSRQKTIECCDRIIRNVERLPQWWPTGQRNCSTAGVVKCFGGKRRGLSAVSYSPSRRLRCFIEIPFENNGPSIGFGGSRRGGNLQRGLK
jgi:hypothetical protein